MIPRLLKNKQINILRTLIEIVAYSKKAMFFMVLLLSFTAFAQVGINNTSPNASLEITASDTTTPANTDGILIPRVDKFPASDPGADQLGMMVFLTTTDGTDLPGFYFWNHPTTSWEWVNRIKKIDDLSDGKSEVYDNTADEGPSVFLGDGTGANDDGTNNMNVGLGYNSMNSITSGKNNVGIGYNSMNSVTTGNNNIAIGSNTLNSNINQAGNIAIGSNTLTNNTGKHNVAIGTNALTANIGGKNNVAIGNSALLANTSGHVNVALGPFALRANLSGRDNMAIGTFALGDLSSGVGHVGIGSYALAKYTGVGTQGAGNTAVGSQSLNYMTTGTKNTAIGHQSLQYGTLQEANTAIGHFAGFHAGRDDAVNYNINNTFIGQAAGYAAAGDNNVYLGNSAGAYYYDPTPTVDDNGTPNDDTDDTGGAGSGDESYATGSSNVFIGTGAGNNDTNGVQSDRLIIENSTSTGHLITGNFNTREVGINWNSATALPNTLSVNGTASNTVGGAWVNHSDRRLKKNIETISPQNALEKITSLRGVTYDWNDKHTGAERPTTTQYGFIAQEIMEVFPDNVSKDGLGFYQTAYGNYDALFVQAFKELKNQISEKDQRIKELENQIKLLQEFSERLDTLEAKLDFNTETAQKGASE